MKKMIAAVFALASLPFFAVGWVAGVLAALFGIGFEEGYGSMLRVGAKMCDWWSA